ncbi:hypothetical protein HAX54_016307 [Datura stramonium]|uniref:Uncharacterized protein n=1 Tax=Datura stramonium TaxID=4076 RepID=A0ABS8UKV8_DATST|nr:hypothetical protein [Datura stramonium]
MVGHDDQSGAWRWSRGGLGRSRQRHSSRQSRAVDERKRRPTSDDRCLEARAMANRWGVREMGVPTPHPFMDGRLGEWWDRRRSGVIASVSRDYRTREAPSYAVRQRV